MKSIKNLFILFILMLSFSGESAIDPRDSLIVRSILDKIGWTNVSVSEVVKMSVIPLPNITSSEVKRVTILDLSYREGLPKIEILPSEISRLPELNTLILKGNSIKELPSNFSTLYKLIEIDLSYNKFSAFPSSLQGLSLRIINLSHNFLETIPEWIDTLQEIQSASFSNNIIKVIPLQIVNLKKLNTLNLDSNLISSLPQSIITTDIKIGIHGNRLCKVDSLIARWLDLHSIKANWQASQRCDDRYSVTSVITDITTGTVVHISTDEIKSSDCKPIEISEADLSSLQWFPNQKILKAVEIKFNSCFVPTNTYFLLTFTLEENIVSLVSSTLYSIYYIDKNYEIKYLGGSISKDKKTISVTANMEGKYLLVMDDGKSSIKNIEISKYLSPIVTIISNRDFIELKFTHTTSSFIDIRFFLLNGRCVYKVRHLISSEGNIVKIARKDISSHSPILVEVRGEGGENKKIYYFIR